MPDAKFQIYKDVASYYRWRMRDEDENIIAIGKAFISKNGARSVINYLRNAAAKAEIEDLT